MLTVSYYENIEIHLYSQPVLLLSSCMQRDALKAAGECYADDVIRLSVLILPGIRIPAHRFPSGMVQLSPDNGLPGRDRISGYFYPDSTIAGFSHTHPLRYGGGRFV